MKTLLKAVVASVVIAAAFAPAAQAEVRFTSGFSTSTTKTNMAGTVKVTGTGVKTYNSNLTGVTGDFAFNLGCRGECAASAAQTDDFKIVGNYSESSRDVSDINVMQSIESSTVANSCDTYVDFSGLRLGNSNEQSSTRLTVTAVDTSVTNSTVESSFHGQVFDGYQAIGSVETTETSATKAVSALTTTTVRDTGASTITSYFGK